MDGVRTQWLLIALGAAIFVGLTAWLLSVGLWWLIAALVAVSGHAGYVAWQEGLPLWPGAAPRRHAP